MSLLAAKTDDEPIIDDATAWQYYEGLDTASAADRPAMSRALMRYADAQEAKQRAATDKHYERAYTDDAFKEELADNPTVKLAIEHNPSPDTVKNRALNMSFLSKLTGRELRDVEFDAVRDGFAQAYYGKSGKTTDDEFFTLTRTAFQTRNRRRVAEANLQFSAVAQALEDTNAGTYRDLSQTFQAWKVEHSDLVDDKNEAQFYVGALRALKQTQQDLEEFREPAGKAFAVLKKFSNGEATDEDVLDLANTFAGVPTDKRTRLYGYLAMAAEGRKIDRAAIEQIAENLGNSVSRSFDFLGKGSLRTRQMNLLNAIEVAKQGLFQIRESDGQRVMQAGTIYEGKEGYRKPTEEEKTAFEAELTAALPAIQIAREMKAVARDQIDPIRPVWGEGTLSGTIERGSYGLAGSTGIMAATAINPILGGLAIADEEYDNLLVQNPDLDPGAAWNISVVSAVGQAAIEKLQVDTLMGRLPMFGKLIEDMAPGLKKWTTATALAIGEQNIQEGAQDLISSLVPAIASALREDMPDQDFNKVMGEWAGQRGEVFFAVLPLALVGGSFANFSDFKDGGRFLMADDMLAAAGFNAEQRDYIKAASSQEDAEARYREMFPQRDQKAGVAKVKSMFAEAKQAQDDPASPTLTSRILPDGATEWTVTSPGNPSFTTRSEETARLAYEESTGASQQARNLSEEGQESQQREIALSEFLGGGMDSKDELVGSEADGSGRGNHEVASGGQIEAFTERVTGLGGQFVWAEDIRSAGKTVPGVNGGFLVKIHPDRLKFAENAGRESGLKPGEMTAAVFEEELIHGAHILSFQKEWEDGGRKGSFADFVDQKNGVIFQDIRQTLEAASPDERAALQDALVAAWNAYSVRFAAPERPTPRTEKVNPDTILTEIQGDGILGVSRFVAEFLRQAGQLKRSGRFTEELHIPLLTKLAEWVRDAIARIRQMLPKVAYGDFGPMAKETLKRIEQILDGEIDVSAFDSAPVDPNTDPEAGFSSKPIDAEARLNYLEKRLAALDKAPDARRNAVAKARFALWNMEEWHAQASTGKYGDIHANMIAAFGRLRAINEILPPEVRGRVPAGYRLAEMKTEKERLQFLGKQIATVGKELERWLKNDTIEAIEKVFESTRYKLEAGVPRSTLGAETQAYVDKARRASYLTEEEAEDKINALIGRLRRQDLTPEQREEISEELAIVNQFGNLEGQAATTLAQTLKELQNEVKQGREKRRVQTEAQFAALRAKQALVVSGLPAKSQKKFKARKDAPWYTQAADLFTEFGNWHRSFEGFMRQLLPKEAQGLVDDWVIRMRKGDNAVQDMEIAATEGLNNTIRAAAKGQGMSLGKAYAFLKDIHKDSVTALNDRKVTTERINIELAKKIVRGQADPSKLKPEDIRTLREELENLPRNSKREFITIRRVIFAGKAEQLDMSRGDAIQLLLTWRQPDARQKMRRLGWTDESITQMRELTADPISQAVMGYLIDYYGKSASVVNPVYQRMFGMGLAQVENYAPTRYFSVHNSSDMGPDDQMIDPEGSLPSFTKKRIQHSSPVDFHDALTIFRQHVLTQAHWVHFAELTKEVSGVLRNPEIAYILEQENGRLPAKGIDLWIRQLQSRGANRAREADFQQRFIGALIGGKAISALGLNLKTVAMQFDSAMRFALAVPVKQVVKALTDPVGLMESMPKAWHSPAVQRRIKGGSSPAIQFLYDRAKAKPNIGAQAAHMSMAPIQWGDAGFTAFSSAIVFKASFDESIANGMNETMATNKALDDVDAAVYRFSQPVGFGAKSLIENNGWSGMRALMLFMSDPRLKAGVMLDAVHGLMSGKGDAKMHVQRLLAIEGMALVSHVVANLYRDAFSDDDDDDIWSGAGFARAAALAPFQGYFLLGAITDVAVTRMLGMGLYTPTKDPLIDAYQRVDAASRNVGDTLNISDPEAMFKQWEKIAKAIALRPDMAAPAVLFNAAKPITGLRENLEGDQ